MKIFELFGDILLNDKASSQIDDVSKKGKVLGVEINENITKVAAFGTAAVAAGVAAGGALLKIATDASDVASRINDMSAKMGISTRGFQEWDYVLKQSGVDIGVLQGGMKTLNNVIDAATQGGEDQIAMFKKLGVSLTDNEGKLKDTETIFNEVVTALQGMPEGANKAALSNDLLGKSSTEMSAIINGTSKDLVNMKNRANELGLVMSEEAVAAGDEFGDTLEDVKMSLGAIGREIGTALMPPLKSFLDFLLDTAIPGIKKWWEDTVYGFKQVQLIALNMASGVLGAFLGLGKGIDSIWLGIVKSALGALNGVMDMLGGWIDDLNKMFGTNFAKPNFEQFGKNIIEGMKAGAESDLDRTVSILKDAFDITAQEIEASFTKTGGKIQNISKNVSDSIIADAKRVKEAILNNVTENELAAKNLSNFLANETSRNADVLVNFYKEDAKEQEFWQGIADKNIEAEKQKMLDKAIEIATQEYNFVKDLVVKKKEDSNQANDAMIASMKKYQEYVKQALTEQNLMDEQVYKDRTDRLNEYVNEASRCFSTVTRMGLSIDEKMKNLIQNINDGMVNLSVWINTTNKWTMAEWDAYRALEAQGAIPEWNILTGAVTKRATSSVTQNITINSPKPLSASEVARHTKNASKTVYMN